MNGDPYNHDEEYPIFSSVYYAPKQYGLEIIGTVDWTDESYEFDMTCVWRHTSGQLYIASDHGCSCPAPFEEYRSVEDLDKVTKHEAIMRLKKIASTYPNGLARCANLIERILHLKEQ